MMHRVFIGSSGAAEKYARQLLQIIDEERDADFQVDGWWQRNRFKFGSATLESLEEAAESCNAALLVAAPDDFAIKKDQAGLQTRDNVIFEYGLFCGKVGRGRSVLAILPDAAGNTPMLPSDFDGITQMRLQFSNDLETFRDANRAEVRSWMAQLREEEPVSDLDAFPLLQAAVGELLTVTERHPDRQPEIDRFGADLLNSAARLLDTKDYGFAQMYGALLKRNLRSSTSIYAVDVLGPSAWMGPSSFRYLSVQLWQYIRANTVENKLLLRVSDDLANAIERALAAATDPKRFAQRTLGESLTDFDSKREIDWQRAKPVTEYARVLLWSRKELVSPIADSVIAIHEAFHVPLFFLEAEADAALRRQDYLLFRQDETDEVFGFLSKRAKNFQPETVDDRKTGLPLLQDFRKLLGDEKLMFALDARHYYSE